MIDGDAPKSEEERLEEIKFEIKGLFDGLGIKVADPKLNILYDSEKKLTLDLSKEPNETKELSEHVKFELRIFFRLLETIENDQCHNYNEHEAMQIRVALAHIRMYYELGKMDIALDLLYDPDDPDSGAESQARNITDRTEENKKVYQDIRRLTDLIDELRSNK